MSRDPTIRLLLVEDNPAHADLAAEYLSEVPGHAFEVVVAPTLAEALESTSRSAFDAVVLDLNLPDSRGVDTVRRLREAHGNLPVVVVSSVVDDELRSAVMREGAHDVVNKADTSSMVLPRSILYAAELGRVRNGEQQMQRLLSSAPEAMVVVGRDGTVQFSNAAAERLLGGGAATQLRLGTKDDDSEELDVHAGDAAFRGEFRLAEMDWDGKPASLVVLRDLRDREARRVAEAKAVAAEHSLELFKSVVEAMPVGVRLFRRESAEDFRLQWENVAAHRAWASTFTPTKSDVLAACRTASSFDSTQALPDIKDGDPHEPERVYAVRAAPVTKDIVGVFCEDVTERISLAAQLRQAQKMEAIGRLAGGIAHDFNNLLTVIISFASLVRDGLENEELAAQDLDEVLGAADRAATLTRQLLAVSRRQPIAPRVMDVNEMVIDVSRILRRAIGEDVEIVAVPGVGLWPIFIDVGHFEQIMMNLAVNARDAMPRGGKFIIETENATDDERGELVVVRVSDTGVGMGEEVAAHMFEPFFTTKDEGKGTGLGLAMVYGMVLQAAGTIDVTTEAGVGTTFTLRFPRSTLTYRPPAPAIVTANLFGTETVLVVEDEPKVRAAIRRFLERHGYRVIEATDGDEALRVFAEHADRVDLVLTDVVMPQMNGRELVEQLHARYPDHRFKTLLMSGYNSDGLLEDPSATGYQWMEKPFTEERLLLRVRRVIDNGE